MSERHFTTKQFAELVNREVSTLYEWAYTGKLKPKKDFNNRNIYTAEDYKKVTGLDLKQNEEVT